MEAMAEWPVEALLALIRLRSPVRSSILYLRPSPLARFWSNIYRSPCGPSVSAFDLGPLISVLSTAPGRSEDDGGSDGMKRCETVSTERNSLVTLSCGATLQHRGRVLWPSAGGVSRPSRDVC